MKVWLRTVVILCLVVFSIGASAEGIQIPSDETKQTLLDSLSLASGRDAESIERVLKMVRVPRSVALAELHLSMTQMYTPSALEKKPIISKAGFLQFVNALSIPTQNAEGTVPTISIQPKTEGEIADVISEILKQDSRLNGTESAAGSKPVKVIPFPREMKEKYPGVNYVYFESGREAPVIDVVNFPDLFKPMDAPQSERNRIQSLKFFDEWPTMPAEKKKMAFQHAFILRASFGGAKVLSGEATYFSKIGFEMAGAYGKPFQFAITGKLPTEVTYRLISMTKLVARGVRESVESMEKEGRKPETIRIIDIAGGSGITDLNAILKLAKENPEILKGRKIIVNIFDLDEVAPKFAVEAFKTYQRPGQPLHGYDITVQPVLYNWNKPEALEAYLKKIDDHREAVVTLSEGGIFEYAEDAVVEKHMDILAKATSKQVPFIGSAFWSQGYEPNKVDPCVTRCQEISDFGWKFRFPSFTEPLFNRFGWKAVEVESNNGMAACFLLKKRHN